MEYNRMIFTQLTDVNKKAIGHQSKDLIRFCSFELNHRHPNCYELYEGDITIVSKSDGLCFAFNFNETIRNASYNFTPLKSLVPIAGTGLTLVLNINTMYDMADFSWNQGVKMYLHGPNQIPLVDILPAYR